MVNKARGETMVEILAVLNSQIKSLEGKIDAAIAKCKQLQCTHNY
jgi:hypothetical protein